MQHSPRLLLPRAVQAALRACLEQLGDSPSETRVLVKDTLYQLERAYRFEHTFGPCSEVDVAQAVAEEDGEEIQDAP